MKAIENAIEIIEKYQILGREQDVYTISLCTIMAILKDEAEKEKEDTYKEKCKKRDMEKKISRLEGTISRQDKTIKRLSRSLLLTTNKGDN